MDFQTLPPWQGTAIAGATIAVVGHVWTQLMQWRAKIRESERSRRSRLSELYSAIRAGDAAWAVQCEHRDTLEALIKKRSPELAEQSRGFDHLFKLAYQTMTPEEHALHDMVRAITIHTVRPINRSLLKWLTADTEFRIRPIDSSPRGDLAGYLQKLEVHLILWEAKYQIWIPKHPELALVYLADEERHGIEFPKRGVEIVRAVLDEKKRIDA